MALRSALAQTEPSIEVIVVDDCSNDDTVRVAREFAASDARVRVITRQTNGGPAAARNTALAQARGAWFTVLDSDDLYDADRIARLVAIGEAGHADMVADNFVSFAVDDLRTARPFLPPDETGRWVDSIAYLNATRLYAGCANLGYLKPMIRTNVLNNNGILYNEAIRIGEDDDLVLRLLLAGARYWYEPMLTYGYRVSNTSISHRFSATNAAASAVAAADIASASCSAALNRALRARHRAIVRARDFALLVNSIKSRRPVSTLRLIVANPMIVPLLREAIEVRLRAFRPLQPTLTDDTAHAALLRMVVAAGAACADLSTGAVRPLEVGN